MGVISKEEIVVALIICPDCGKEISDKSVNCINCGCPIQEIKNEEQKRQMLEQRKKAIGEQIRQQKKELDQEREEFIRNVEPPEKPVISKKILLICGVLCCISAICGICYFSPSNVVGTLSNNENMIVLAILLSCIGFPLFIFEYNNYIGKRHKYINAIMHYDEYVKKMFEEYKKTKEGD